MSDLLQFHKAMIGLSDFLKRYGSEYEVCLWRSELNPQLLRVRGETLNLNLAAQAIASTVFSDAMRLLERSRIKPHVKFSYTKGAVTLTMELVFQDVRWLNYLYRNAHLKPFMAAKLAYFDIVVRESYEEAKECPKTQTKNTHLKATTSAPTQSS